MPSVKPLGVLAKRGNLICSARAAPAEPCEKTPPQQHGSIYLLSPIRCALHCDVVQVLVLGELCIVSFIKALECARC